MECAELHFSGHAIRRMFARRIAVEDVRTAIDRGEVIERYPNDTPYPSVLLLGHVGSNPMHVVVAREEVSTRCIVVTVYWPDELRWLEGFRRRRQ